MAPEGDNTPLPDLHGFTLLVVEDDVDTADLVVSVLQQCGARVFSAQRASHARQVFNDVRPKLIVCDLALPGEDGLAFTEWVRQQPGDRGRDVPVIAYTAYDTHFRQAMRNRAGFSAIVKKPSEPAALCWAVSDVLKGPRRE
jgi:CheY-like chemotaxis protein